MGRREVRENVFKLAYELVICGQISDESLEEATRSAEKQFDIPKEEDELYVRTPEEQAFFPIDGDRKYFDKVIGGIVEKREEIESTIKRYARSYDFDRLYKVDRAILLVAVYEILYMDDIPYKVSVNEAVELAKIYSTEKSASYINGILASVIKNTEEHK